MLPFKNGESNETMSWGGGGGGMWFVNWIGKVGDLDQNLYILLCRKSLQIPIAITKLKEDSTFLEIGSFYNSPRVKQLSFTVFESIQPISGSGGSTFSLF